MSKSLSVCVHICFVEIVKIDFDAGKIYVTFTYWSDQYDEWINISDSATKLAPLHAHTYTDENGIEGRNLKIKQRIEVKDPYGKWLESFVIAENTTEVNSIIFSLILVSFI